MSLRGFVEEYARLASPQRVFSLAARLSKLHRVQGGEEILEAARVVKEELEIMGVEARLVSPRGWLGLSAHWFFWEPRGWRLVDARVEEKTSTGWREVASTVETPLVAITHSPRGEASGKAMLVYGEERSLEEDYAGTIPVVVDFNVEAYHALAERGAEAVIATHEGPGVRYYALFPSRREEPRMPAASLEQSRALRLAGLEVRVSVDAEYAEPTTPIVYARVGADEPSILLAAHICHPAPGAHDNASGVAAVVEALMLLSEKSRSLEEAGISVEALLVPEYTGTAAAVAMGIVRPNRVLAAASIDMVGSDLEKTGGSLNLYHSLLAHPSLLDPLLYASLWLSHEHVQGFDSPGYPLHGVHLLPYSTGSDHDVLMALGVPSSLVNEWPDRFYHTSLDSPENLSSRNLAGVATAIAAAVEAVARIIASRRELEVLRKWAERLAAKTVEEATLGILPRGAGEAAREAAGRGVDYSASRLAGILGRGQKSWKTWEVDVEKIARRGPISTRYLAASGEEAARKLKSLPRRERRLYAGVVAIAVQATRSTRAAIVEALASRGERVDRSVLDLIVDLVSKPASQAL